MSNLYESIPHEAEIAYLNVAAEAARQAEDGVIFELGREVLGAAGILLQEDYQASSIGDDATKYIKENDITAKFREETEGPENIDMGISEHASEWLKGNFVANAYGLQTDRAAMKHAFPSEGRQGPPNIQPGGASSA